MFCAAVGRLPCWWMKYLSHCEEKFSKLFWHLPTDCEAAWDWRSESGQGSVSSSFHSELNMTWKPCNSIYPLYLYLHIHYIYIYNVMCDALLNPFKGGLYGKWRDLQAVWCERISNYPVLQVQYCTIGTLYFWHKTFKILLSFKMFSTFLWQCPRPTLISTAVPLYFFTKKIVLWARNVFISTHLEFV